MHTFIDSKIRPRLFILAGIPGSGKSTWARIFFHQGQIVSSDEIREAKWPGEPYQRDRNEEVFDEFYRRIGVLLERGQDAVADATSLKQEARWRLSDIADYYDAEKHLIFFSNARQGRLRNKARSGKTQVPPEEQEEMLVRSRAARYAILYEPYTSITIIEATL